MKSAKDLNATHGFSFCKSILGLGLTCLSMLIRQMSLAYGILAHSPHAADQSDDHDMWDCIPWGSGWGGGESCPEFGIQ